MIGPFVWLIYLLTYLDIECALLGSRLDGLVSMVKNLV